MVTKDKWIEIIKDWIEKEIPAAIPRDNAISLNPKLQRAISIIGPRRSGKTYEMFILLHALSIKVGKDKAIYFNLERADLGAMTEKDLVSMLEAYYELNPNNKKKEVWLFLDEIQNVSGWEKFVRTCLDDGIHIVLSGSSSKLLSKEIATSMAGRNISYGVFPFSFEEVLRAKGFSARGQYSSGEKAQLQNFLEEYLHYGGYPEAVLYSEQRERILKDIFETAILKDVIERHKIRNTAVMKMLMKALLGAKEFSINKFHNYLKSQGLRSSKTALYNYVGYLEDAFFIVALKKFSLSYKKAEQSLPKIYFIDNGLLTIHNIDDKGRLMENLVCIELLRQEKEISYYQNALKEEVDFLVRKGKKVLQLIQVCHDVDNFTTLDRETRILLKASQEFNCDNLLIITRDKDEQQILHGKKITFIPLRTWLLAKQS